MSNPFYYGGRVEPDQFVGRQSELRRIFAALEIAHTGQMQSVSVVGPRRIGKSSLLCASSRDIFGCSKNRQNRIVENSTYPLDDFGFR